MSVPVIQVLELKDRIKQRADIEKSGSAGVSSDLEILRLINLYMYRLEGLIQKAYENYRAQYYNLKTVVGQVTYPLPANFSKLLGIGIVDVAGKSYNVWTPLQHWQMANQNRPTGGFINFTNGMYSNVTFRLMDGNIEFIPVKSAQIIGVWYAPTAQQFRDFNESLPAWIQPGWEEYLVAGPAMMIAAKEQRSAGISDEIFKMIEAQIASFIPNRDSYLPETVQRAWAGQNAFPFGAFPTGFYGGGSP
jgi:hypothetical protein